MLSVSAFYACRLKKRLSVIRINFGLAIWQSHLDCSVRGKEIPVIVESVPGDLVDHCWRMIAIVAVKAVVLARRVEVFQLAESMPVALPTHRGSAVHSIPLFDYDHLSLQDIVIDMIEGMYNHARRTVMEEKKGLARVQKVERCCPSVYALMSWIPVQITFECYRCQHDCTKGNGLPPLCIRLWLDLRSSLLAPVENTEDARRPTPTPSCHGYNYGAGQRRGHRKIRRAHHEYSQNGALTVHVSLTTSSVGKSTEYENLLVERTVAEILRKLTHDCRVAGPSVLKPFEGALRGGRETRERRR